jgi:hypothetical protein
MWNFGDELVKEKILEIEEKTAAAENADIHAELGDDFLTYLILSGKMGADEIAVNAICMLTAERGCRALAC